MSRVLAITGVGGYLGQNLASYIQSRTELSFDLIIGFDIKKLTSSSNVPINYHQCDVREPFSHILEEHGVTDLVHMAWVVNPVHNVRKAFDIDINGTKNTLYEALKAGVTYFLHTSSTLGYGAHPDNPYPLTEDHPLRGNSKFHYSYHKKLAEEVIDEFEKTNIGKMKIGRARPSGILSSELNNYITETLSGGWRTLFLLPYPVSNTPIQFLHINDALKGFETMLKYRLEGPYNITPNEDIQVGDIPKILGGRGIKISLFLLKMLLFFQWKFRISHAPPAYLDFVAYPFVASNKKIKKFGFDPKYSTVDAFLTLKQKN